MPEKRWEFELDGARHAVELEHNTFSNRQSVRVDGQLIQPLSGAQTRQLFRIGNHTCEVSIARKSGKYAYDFLIDGVSNTPEQYSKELAEAQTSERMRAMRWGGVIICLSIGVAGTWFSWSWAHSRGYFYDELAVVAPVAAVLGLYWLVSPKDFVAQYSGISLRMGVVIAIALLVGFANMYALSHGWY